MMFQILLISGTQPRYFAGFGRSESGTSCCIATGHRFEAKYYEEPLAVRASEILRSEFPFAKIVTA